MKKTNKVFLLGGGTRLNIITSLLIILSSILNLSGSTYKNPTVFYLLGISGLILFFFTILSTAKKSKYSPKVILNDKSIEFKTTFFGKKTCLMWSTIQSIDFKPYQVLFHFEKSTLDMNYVTLPYISTNIKDAIRRMAETKGVEVTGG